MLHKSELIEYVGKCVDEVFQKKRTHRPFNTEKDQVMWNYELMLEFTARKCHELGILEFIGDCGDIKNMLEVIDMLLLPEEKQPFYKQYIEYILTQASSYQGWEIEKTYHKRKNKNSHEPMMSFNKNGKWEKVLITSKTPPLSIVLAMIDTFTGKYADGLYVPKAYRLEKTEE